MRLIVWAIVFFITSFHSFSQKIRYSPLENLTTSGRLPKNIRIQRSNNNLDLVYFKERYYLAFRTAPSHFPSAKTRLYVVSSSDRKNWSYETEFFLNTDLREPRFAVLRDTLYLYFFAGGKNPFKFEPKKIFAVKYTGIGNWDSLIDVKLDGYVPWRIRNKCDTLYLSAYYGKNLYRKNHRSDLRLFWSVNARDWFSISQHPQVDIPFAEEGEFIFDKEGCIYSVVRLESNGSLICKGNMCDPKNWRYRRSKHKYDSALLMEHNNNIYLIARRNVPGEMDRLKERKNEKQGRLKNLIHYWFSSKKTALYKLNKENLSITHLFDFPSNGDNAFPAIAKVDSNSYILMNYSSDIKSKNKVWFTGQLGKTYIYETLLTFEDEQQP